MTHIDLTMLGADRGHAGPAMLRQSTANEGEQPQRTESDRMSLHPGHANDVMRFLQGRLRAALHQLDALPPTQPYPDHTPTPAGIASQVMQHGTRALARQGVTGLHHVRDAVHSAFAAADIYHRDSDSADLAQAREQSLGGLDRLETQYQASSIRQQASIQIQTRDGDIVTIEIGTQQDIDAASFTASDAHGTLAAYESQLTTSMSLRFSVKGELDAEEQQAIGTLLDDLQGLGESLIAGDSETAWAAAAQLHLDGDTLAGFTAHFSAAASYQEMKATYATDLAPTDTAIYAPHPGVELLHDPPQDLPRLLQHVLDFLHDTDGGYVQQEQGATPITGE